MVWENVRYDCQGVSMVPQLLGWQSLCCSFVREERVPWLDHLLIEPYRERIPLCHKAMEHHRNAFLYPSESVVELSSCWYIVSPSLSHQPVKLVPYDQGPVVQPIQAVRMMFSNCLNRDFEQLPVPDRSQVV